MHDHQPVGNFGWVIEEIYEKSYKPFLDVAERHPGFRFCLHVTGPLFEWIDEHRPEWLDRVRALVEAGRRALPSMVSETELSFSALGDDVVILGSSAMILKHELGII